jgi:hypothetical protein
LALGDDQHLVRHHALEQLDSSFQNCDARPKKVQILASLEAVALILVRNEATGSNLVVKLLCCQDQCGGPEQRSHLPWLVHDGDGCRLDRGLQVLSKVREAEAAFDGFRERLLKLGITN